MGKLRIFELNDKEEIYEEVDNSIPKTALFDENTVLLFLNDIQQTVWIWIGAKANEKQRFLGSYKASVIRDLYGCFSYKIKSAEQGDEPLGFKMMIGTDITPPKWEAPEVHITKTEQGHFVGDNRGNLLYISNEYFPKFKKMVNKL